LTITRDEIDQGLKILRQSLSAFEPKKIVP